MNLPLDLLLLFTVAFAIDLTPEQLKEFRKGQITLQERNAINANRKAHTMHKLIALREKLGDKDFAAQLEKRKEALKRLSQVRRSKFQKISEEDEETMEQMKKWSSEQTYASQASIVDINQEVLDYLYEGDILIPSEKIEQLIAKENSTSRGKRGSPVITATLWDKNKPIPYYFENTMHEMWRHSEEDRTMIREALKEIESKTCIRFEENENPVNKIRVTNGDGCSSYIGVYGGTQELSLRNDWLGTCMQTATIQHEFLHALGIGHTQSRHDRDQYVTVNTANIHRDNLRNFNIRSASENDNFGVPYGYGSAMHYGPYDMGLNESIPTLIPRSEEYMYSMGNRLSLTYNDIRLVNSLYKCHENCPTKIECGGVRGYQNPKNCSVCICNEFFEGANCEIKKFREAKKFVRIQRPEGENWQIAGFGVSNNLYDYDPEKAVRELYHYKNYPKKFFVFNMAEPSGYEMHFTLITESPALECAEACYSGGVTIIESDVEDDFSGEGKTFCCNEHRGYVLKSRARFVGVKITQSPGSAVDFGVDVIPVAI